VAELVADCPRCGSKKITFDLTQELLVGVRYNWQQWYETFCICRHCRRSTVFVLSQNVDAEKESVHKNGLVKQVGAVNRLMNIEGTVSRKDNASVEPPAHLPAPIDTAFREGATYLAVECFNAAGTMFRLCVDIATRTLLPAGEAEGLNAKVRRDLGLRLPWLFANNYLPAALHDLSTCIKEDGNDGAHAGTLSKADAEDLLDFTVALLERLYTEPERLRQANLRRERRRAEAKKDA
jgi:uncharacterized protein DUF4145